MAERLFGFNADAVARIGAVVRERETKSPSPSNTPTDTSRPSAELWIQLTDEDGSNPGTYKWKTVRMVDREFEDTDPLITSGDDYSAIEANRTTGLSDSFVRVQYWGRDESGKPRYVFGGVSGSLPAGQYQHMVYQNVTQNQSGFDFVQAHALP